MPVILQWLAWAVVLLTFIGAAVVFLRGSKDKGTIETLERNNAALDARVKLLEAEDTRKGDRIKALEQANEVLAGVANSGELIASFRVEVVDLVAVLKTSLDEHHTAAMAGMTQLHQDLRGIATTLGGTE